MRKPQTALRLEVVLWQAGGQYRLTNAVLNKVQVFSNAGWCFRMSLRSSSGFKRSATSHFPCGHNRKISVHILPLHVNMHKFVLGKKFKKSSKPSTKLLLGIPTNVAVGPVGFRAALDTNLKGKRNRSYRGLRSTRFNCDPRP